MTQTKNKASISYCRMCLLPKKLERSHLIPRALYKYLRTSDSSPIHVGEGMIWPSDSQLRDYLLCQACEDVLNKGGEKWLNPKFARMDRTFPLYDLLSKGPVAFRDDEGALYYTRDNPEIDAEKITHFALGIFWKASVHSWKKGEPKPMIDLGGHSEAIRKWLLGLRSFPKNLVLWVGLSFPHRAQITLNQPSETMDAKEGLHCFVMHLLGVQFYLYTGPNIPVHYRYCCFYSSPLRPIGLSERVTATFEHKLVSEFQEARQTDAYLKVKSKRDRGRGGSAD